MASSGFNIMSKMHSDLLKQLNELIQLGEAVQKSPQVDWDSPNVTYLGPSTYSNTTLTSQFCALGVSFLAKVYGKDNDYYIDFKKLSEYGDQVQQIDRCMGILYAIKIEFENGYLYSLSGKVTADVFDDYMEMAEQLLKQNYIIPTAVLIGATLEAHLRVLSVKNEIATTDSKGRNLLGDALNSQLAKAGIYGKSDQKLVTAWQDIRNACAHGDIDSLPTKEQVNNMWRGVDEFMKRINLK
jgi:hypothetical protein